MRRPFFVLLLVSVLLSIACSKKNTTASTPSDSIAQQLGDAMSSIDDIGGSDGGYALLHRESRVFAKRFPSRPTLLAILFPEAHATSCLLTDTWGSCTSNQVVRDFQSCTLGGITFSGTITFDFNDGTVNNVCTMDSNGDTISRDPDFTITGSSGGAYSVSKTGTVGQRITRTGSGTFEFTNDGIRRILLYQGTSLADYTTTTLTAVGISGASRSGRVANGGTMRVVNNLTDVSCDFTPSNVTWDNTCNCAISGTWTATCSNSDTVVYTMSGCGSGTLTSNGSSETVTLDQCSSL